MRRGEVAGALGILERRELVLPHARPHHEVLGEAEDVEDELLHLDAVGLLRTDDGAVGAHVRDLLLGDVVDQLALVLVANAPQEVEREEVDAEVGRPVRQGVVRVAEPGGRRSDFRILNNLKQRGFLFISHIWPFFSSACDGSIGYGFK